MDIGVHQTHFGGGIVGGGGQKRAAVGSERHAGHQAGVRRHRVHAVATTDVPHLAGVVAATGRNQVTADAATTVRHQTESRARP